MLENTLHHNFAPRHFYEVILREQPCWLYFDLEFTWDANPDVDAAATFNAFSEVLATFCFEKFGEEIAQRITVGVGFVNQSKLL